MTSGVPQLSSWILIIAFTGMQVVAANVQGKDCKAGSYEDLLTLYEDNHLPECWSQVYAQSQKDAPLNEQELLQIMQSLSNDTLLPDYIGNSNLSFLSNSSGYVSYENEQKIGIDVKIYGKLEENPSRDLKTYSLIVVALWKNEIRPIVSGFNFLYTFRNETNNSIHWQGEAKKLTYVMPSDFLPIPNREKIMFTEGRTNIHDNNTISTNANSIILAKQSTNFGIAIKESNYQTFNSENEEPIQTTGSSKDYKLSQRTNSTYLLTGSLPQNGIGTADVRMEGSYVSSDSGRQSGFELSFTGSVSLNRSRVYEDIIWPGIFLVVF